MAYSTLPVEILCLTICILSLIINSIAITIVVYLKKQSKLTNGLNLILLVSSYDLIAPVVGLAQGISSRVIGFNILEIEYLCQIIGILESLVPFLSTGAVTFLSLERYFFILQIIIPKSVTIAVTSLHFAIGITLAVLASVHEEYTMASSRMICMVRPSSGIFGRIWFYSLLIFLILHTIIIVFCYIKIITLRRLVSKTIKIPIESIATSNQSQNHTTENFITKHFNGIPTTMSENSEETAIPPQSFISFKPDRFVIKAMILMISYLICLLPSIVILIYQAARFNMYGSIHVGPLLSNLMFLPLFSLSVINPILLISLHTKVSNQLSLCLDGLFGCFKF
ncbi:hypothetical protein K502DRAFT_368076 [Neoconidiobolus thromboides FSU 785]|nr:hypothetical protein K502DRAFT_368076 [Neoconidiobolus thromboides FSU 785]